MTGLANQNGSWMGEHTNSGYDQAVSCVVGLFAIRCFGALQMSRVASFVCEGPFAAKSLPATPKYASTLERLKIQKLGNRYGCHTCGIGSPLNRLLYGTSEVIDFHADHVPPNYIAKRMKALGMEVTQRFYPQCPKCSHKQGGVCKHYSSAFSKTTLEHAFRSRPQCYAAGALLAGARTFAVPIDLSLGLSG